MSTIPSSIEHRIVKTIFRSGIGNKNSSSSGVSEDYSSIVLADFLASRFTYHSKEEWIALIFSSVVNVNGLHVVPEYLLCDGDEIEYHVEAIPEPPVDTSYSVIFEDDSILVVDKPGDLPCHPAGPFYKNTLWFVLRQKYGAIYMINRLDRETSGIILVGKSSDAARFYSAQLPRMQKRYVALVHGNFTSEVQADGFLERDVDSVVRKKRRFVRYSTQPDAQSCSTTLRPLFSSGGISKVEATLHTGRTHQIRATLCSLGFPLVGDKLYGVDDTIFLKTKGDNITAADWKKLILPRQALHAASVTIELRSGVEMLLTAPEPEFYSFSGKSLILSANSDI